MEAPYLDTHGQKTEQHDLVLRNQLRESNQNSSLKSHSAMILCSISVIKQEDQIYDATFKLINIQEKIGVSENQIFQPVDGNGYNVGNNGRNCDEFSHLDRTPKSLQVSQRYGDEDQCEQQLKEY